MASIALSLAPLSCGGTSGVASQLTGTGNGHGGNGTEAGTGSDGSTGTTPFGTSDDGGPNGGGNGDDGAAQGDGANGGGDDSGGSTDDGSPGNGSNSGPIFLPDGAVGGDGCVPGICAAIGANACGLVDDWGQAINCGACPATDTCNKDTHSCESKNPTCAKAGAQCGVIVDTCGVAIECGSCPTSADAGASQICDAKTNQCVACVPPTTAECAFKCGTLTGCGVTVDCGTTQCTGAPCDSATNTCGCKPLTCSSPGVCDPGTGVSDGCGNILHNCTKCAAPPPPAVCSGKCGEVANTCGDEVACGGCTGGKTCTGSTCKCPTVTCPANSCTNIVNTCTGATIVCTCGTGTTCSGGSCCAPATGCPADYCGPTWKDPCSGTVFPCSGTCATGQCGASGGPDNDTCCTPTTCAAGFCGSVFDPCTNTTINCGTNCASPEVCSAANGTACCTPAVECPIGWCGATWTDPCTGLPVTCTNPACSAGMQCGAEDGGGSEQNLCCTPDTACPTNYCGSFTDPCTGTFVNCATNCGSGQQCSSDDNRTCCTPATQCPSGVCGTWKDPCSGKTISCSGCPSGDNCYDGTCCRAKTCDDQHTPSCQPVSAGCGEPNLVCLTCPSGDVCMTDGSCCQPLTCPQGLNGPYFDGCNATLICNGN